MNLSGIFDIYRTRTLARDLAIRLAIVMTIIIVLLGAIYFLVTVTQATNDLNHQATRLVEELSDVLSLPMWNLDQDSIDQISQAYQQIDNVIGLRVLDNAGNAYYESLPDGSEISPILETRLVYHNEQEIGVVEIMLSTQRISQLQKNIFFQIFGIAAVIVITILISTGILLQKYLNKPLADLTQGIDNIASGDYAFRLAPVPQTDINAIVDSVNVMAEQIETRDRNLEQQVADRTRALETSTEVSRRLSTILDQEQLVREVVEQLRSAFGYYHAHIYLYDEGKQNLVMAGGTGDAGRTMLARGHQIEPGQGLVGRAAASNEVVLISDISQAEGWLPNPLLPDTKAEVAVPIAIGGDVLGVLDVQHNVSDGLTESDVDLIQAIANQVAIAVQNAQAYTRSQRQATQEARITAISQRIQSATTIDDVLKIAVSELGQALETQRASVELKVGSQPDNGRN